MNRREFLKRSFQLGGLAALGSLGIFSEARALGPLPLLLSSVSCDANTILLIRSNSTNENTTFVDLAPVPHTIAAGGNAQHKSAKKKFGTTAIYFDGVNDNLTIESPDADWAFGTSNFTIDFWANVNAIGAGGAFIGTAFDTNNAWSVRVTGVGNIACTYGNGLDLLGTPLVADTWTHIAIERYNNTLYTYANGSVNVTSANVAAVNLSGLANLVIGEMAGVADYAGYLDEIRISNIARYHGANFSVPTAYYCQ